MLPYIFTATKGTLTYKMRQVAITTYESYNLVHRKVLLLSRVLSLLKF